MKSLEDEAKSEKPLLSLFLGKAVTVEVEKGLEVRGKLLRYQYGSRSEGSHDHKPNILIIENGSDKHIIRGIWVSLKTERSL